MQAALGHFAAPEDIRQVIEQLWGSPDTYLHFDHPEFPVYVHYGPDLFDADTPWVKAIRMRSGSTAGDVVKRPMSSPSLAECIRTDHRVYEYAIVEGQPPIRPAPDGEVRHG